ncbi:hypothetical protein OIDMADRAFT_97469, partial [Oidiodendron maius Zn]
IHTCRSLGIQYVWIDSLCIIQDSVPDWEGEAGAMHMVYKNAELMITAYGDVDRSRWNTRGWTMQERSLSTRSVHFCKNKIYFECRSTV